MQPLMSELRTSDAMRPLDTANREILAHLHSQRRRQQEEYRLKAPVRAIDHLLSDLEELHLTGRKRVPEDLDDRLAEIAALLPGRISTVDLRSRITILRLMDSLYAIQDILLRNKTASLDGARAAGADRGLSCAS